MYWRVLVRVPGRGGAVGFACHTHIRKLIPAKLTTLCSSMFHC
jgi:hypothetical protein